ncbi:hypothetical protein RHMOL_Rhmol01G0279600 [Rhododendron molle]|uniref:Uncharacterized protein n=1 Tax=Rhododendron molle TaxID=49168 RepID=A0ACC0Q7X1_RHOML|nr:hypothetical protein RHMOL_Rhmol01G0279600 [Rhododendron molle]
MAACGSLQHIFKKPLPENPTLLESLSPWNQIKSPRPSEASSFTEIFGELHFKDNQESPLPLSSSSSSLSSSSSSLSQIHQNPQPAFEKNDNRKSTDYFSRTQYVGSHKHSDSFSSMNSESLQHCTEGLGFESSDEVEDLNDEMGSDWQNNIRITRHTTGELRRTRSTGRTFPPPISSIGKGGKPWVCFKSYRNEGRFVLKEIRMPTQEFLRAKRENGRLKLQLCMSDEEIYEDDEEDEDEDEENNGDDDCDNDIDVRSEKEGGNGDGKNWKLNNDGVGDC